MLRKKLALSSLILATAVSLSNVPVSEAVESSNPVTFKLNNDTYVNHSGKHILKTAPYALNGTSMLPVRAAAESLGADVKWNQAAQTVTLSGDSFGAIKFTAHSNLAVNGKGERVKLPESVRRETGGLFVPARSLAFLMGVKLDWNAATRSVTLSQKPGSGHRTLFHYSFDKDKEGWEGNFADLPVNYEESIYNLEYARELLPVQGNTTNYALKLSGHNRNDLFMFLSRKVEGFAPNTSYDVKLNFAMYTDAESGMVGIGGAPAESVYIKAGIVAKEPLAVPTDSAGEKYYRMNVDIGNQGEGGSDAKVIGDAAKPDAGKEGYQRVDFQHSTKVTSNAKGEIFILIGSDSGFEGLTTLYFDDIKLDVKKAK
ncbi:copper amine oxidase N-terminal domain-containing protein [Paenibacillaceae bacterium]|nr:copper amine oxidase N-terminal domain-containing protein [Paenibacillaceae bacterium]